MSLTCKVLLGFAMLWSVCCHSLLADVSDSVTPTASEDIAQTHKDQQELTPEQKEQRKQLISISWILLAGIIILGGMVILFAIIWGARTRRITRSPGPDANLKQEFWYLKSPYADSQGSSEAVDNEEEE